MNDCVHHWVIEPMDGRESLPGVCKHCGETKAFPAGEPRHNAPGYHWIGKSVQDYFVRGLTESDRHLLKHPAF